MRCEDARRDSERRGRGSRRVLARARPRGTARGWIVVGLALLVVVPGRAPAAECASSGLEPGVCAPLSGGLDPIPTEELERRLAFLERRLEAGRRNARLWQYGFTGAWSTGLALGSVQAALTDDHDDRLAALVTAGKALIGTTRLLVSSHPGRLGAAPLRVEADDRRAALEAGLVAGERQLLAVERRARSRRSWIAHAANVGLNALGGGLIVALGNPSDAISSVGVGVLFGELMLWTQPGRGERDLADYRARLRRGRDASEAGRIELQIAPGPASLALRIRF